MSDGNDICKHCIVRGDLDTCLSTECSQHNSWYAKQMAARPDSKPYKYENPQQVMANVDSYSLGFHHGFGAARERKEG